MNDIQNNLGTAASKAIDFVEKIIGAPIMVTTGTLTDNINYWRFTNRVNTILKAKAFLEAKGIFVPKKDLLVKDVMTLLEFASFENDDKMQGRWASLLANAADPTITFDLCATFSQMLNQLSALEVAVLDFMYEKFFDGEGDRKFVDKYFLLKTRFETKTISPLLFENLIRLRLLEEESPQINYHSRELDMDAETRDKKIGIQSSTNLRLSEFAVEFVRKTKFV
jgi:hypothetical protein